MTPIKVLLVDDRPENLLALGASLGGCGYELWEASSGLEALKLVEEHDFAAILLDVQMPEMDGFETAKHIREKPLSRATPIIFVTAIHHDEEFEYRGYLSGAVDYLFKPINVDILRAKLGVFAELFRQAKRLKEAALKEQENALLKNSLELRDEFLAMAAHELKTPMTPLNLQMQAFLTMYRDGSIDGVSRERLVRMLETSQGQIDRLSRLISDLVDLSKLKGGKLELEPQAVDLGNLVEGVAIAFAEEAEKVGCKIRFAAEDEIVGHWDKFRIEQAVINILTNAFKYGPGHPVDVRVWSEEGKAFVSVQDQGIGIAPEDHLRIFERFERAASPRYYGGLGLGLYIANNVVKLHQGRISLESALGGGSKFTLMLPKIKMASPA